MLGAVGSGIVGQARALVKQRRGECGIDGDRAQGSLPGAFPHDGKRRANAGMVRAKQQATCRDVNAGVDGAGDVSGVHVAGVGNDAAQSGQRRPFRRKVGADLR